MHGPYAQNCVFLHASNFCCLGVLFFYYLFIYLGHSIFTLLFCYFHFFLKRPVDINLHTFACVICRIPTFGVIFPPDFFLALQQLNIANHINIIIFITMSI